MNRSPFRAFLLIPFVLAYFALSPQARAICQEGCLTNQNTVLGDDALLDLTTGTHNTAIGFNALSSNTTGNLNTAIGSDALLNNTIGSLNTANGDGALELNTVGGDNTAIGVAALSSNITGNSNTAIGTFALLNTNGGGNTAIGAFALVGNTGSANIALGNDAGGNLTTGNNNIDIGNAGVANESQTIRIGTRGAHAKTFIAGISGATVPDGIGVIVGANGKLGTVVSFERFKEAIKPMDKASEAILALKPVTFHYKEEIDPAGIPQFGLVAEDVEKVNPHLVARDADGKPYTVRYEAVNAMLLNEFLKEHRKVEEEGEINRQQQASIARLEAIVKEQALQIQKVTAELAAKNADPRVVSSD